ncbi:hypothetical protein BBO99_00008486 [Phytophthora kernoviae]|uniref:Hexose transporter 1 n=2 Tax=Phytophthora kernoviae TaxID=325452 RepID=A0A421ETW4_9STRA|nr:hypothetical protein G195_010069 [Phytophthora kernoviae 00238/432]RLN02180.1 hypothetical protein BBI17_008449 [Phytophthora kernoviae]RLN75219.1 hypothetical protein BBO99_00008486 [Phytophthora kernoviae]
MPPSPNVNHETGYAIALSPATDHVREPALNIEQRAIGARWIVYTSVGISMLEAFHYGWSSHQINLHKFHNVEDCAARPIAEDTCIMFPGHTKTTWTLLTNAWLVGGMVGSFMSSYPSNKYGRRMTLRMNTIIMVLASVIQVLAPTAAWFGIGRFVAGIANGVAMAVVNTFLSEISTPHNRHALGTNTHLAATLGILGVATTFWYWNTTSGFRWIAGIPIVLAAGYLVTSYFFMVESPVWLVAHGRDDEAEKEIARLYGKENVDAIMSWIQARDSRSKLPSMVSDGEMVQVESESPWTILLNPKFRKQLGVALGLTCINQLVGINAVFWYSSSILTDAGIADARLGVVIIDILNVVPVPIAAYATQFLPKRAMLLWGIFIMALCCIGMTLSMVYGVGWLSVTMLGMYVVGYDVSIGPLLWPMIAELFPDSARGAAVGICVFLKWVCALIIGIAFPYVQEAITDYSFMPFLGTTLMSIVFIYFMVPETSDLTIAEIQNGFRGDQNLQSVKTAVQANAGHLDLSHGHSISYTRDTTTDRKPRRVLSHHSDHRWKASSMAMPMDEYTIHVGFSEWNPLRVLPSMASGGDEAAAAASSINQEQLLHELESKYLSLKSDFSLAESERQTLTVGKKAAVEEAERVVKLNTEREEETRQLKQQLLQVTTEKDALTFKLQTVTSLAERRLTEVEELQTTVREHNKLLVEAQRHEMQALEKAAKQEAQVAPLTHALTRAKKEAEVAHQHSQWLETQVSEKTKTIQELRLDLAKHTHDLEEMKVRSTEELTSAKRQLESARLANKKMDSALIKSKEALKELQAAKVHDEEALQNELSAQRRLAALYQESANDSSARVTELQSVCDSLRKSLAESEQALARETERTKEQVEYLFREQAEASEARIQALQEDLQNAEQKVAELEKKKIFSLQTASAVAELSSAAGEAHLAAHGLTPKQMYDHIVELEETLQSERNEKDKLQLYMDRIVKEVQEKAPVLMGLRLDHERTVASHTQLSERLDHCMQELAKSKSNEQLSLKEKNAFEKKCESLAQSVDDLSRQVQHLLFRSQEQQPGGGGRFAAGDENLVVFKDVEELQMRNQQLLTVIRELTEMNHNKVGKVNNGINDVGSADSSAHLIITGDSDEELDQIGASSAIKKRLALSRKEIQELHVEREQEREMITAIVKQRDMYRVLLAQSDTKFLDGGAAAGIVGTKEIVAPSERVQNRRGSLDIIESRKLREVQIEFEDYKKEKQANLKMLQENLDQERSKSSEARLAKMQAQVEATCNKERYEASEERCANAETELVRLRSKADQLSSLILQHQQMIANTEAKLETATSRLQSLAVEKDAASRETDFLRKNEEKIQQELTTLRLDNTNLLKLMESTRRMESGREERDRREVESLTKKVTTLETKLQDAYEKFDVKEVTSGAQVLAAEREKQAALTELSKLKEVHAQVKERLARLEEQKTGLESKATLLEKETTHLREQLRKGTSAAATERVASLEVQLRDAQREVQASLLSRKTLTEGMTKYKALAEVSEKNLAELSSASEKWKQSEAEKVQALEKTRGTLSNELVKARAQLKEHISENSSLREEIDGAEQRHKHIAHETIEKQKMLQLQADSAVQQMNSVREEMERLKHDLDSTQENYERELQLHAAEVAKSSASRKEMEEIRKAMRSREADIATLNAKVLSIENESHVKLETLQKRFDEAIEAKNAVAEQNKLLHSQLERAAAQVRRAHEQDMLKVVGSNQQDAGEGAAATDKHDKEIDDLRSVVAYLRRESEIAESKLELAQQEMQRGKAQIFSLESTIERLRGEIKSLSDAAAATGKQAATMSADDEKRVAQLEQLSLLRESNATLRDENQKNLAKLKEEASKVRSVEAKLVPLQNADASLKTQVASMKQEIVTLNDANRRWKQRVDQLVEKYQQIDPAEHDKVIAEKEALSKDLMELKAEQSTLKAELETLRSSGGKELEEEKKKVENWSKQYERIKGFAKNWKNKAESLTKQLAEKNQETEERSSAVTTLEAKLSSVQAQINAVSAEKAALETKLAACEASKQEDATAASGATTSWEKERQTLKAQLELETKKSMQLKEFNARLMAGLKSLKKENSELKDHASVAPQPAVAQVKTPVPSPPPSPLEAPPATTTSTTPSTKPVATPAPLFSSPKLVAKSEPAAQQSTVAVSEEKSVEPNTGSVALAATPATPPLPSPPVRDAITTTATTTAVNITTVPTPSTPATTEIISKPVVPVISHATSTPVPTPSPAPPATTTQQKEPDSNDGSDSATLTAEEKLRLFALRSIKKQVGGAARFTPTKASAPHAEATETKPATENETNVKGTVTNTAPFKSGGGTSGFGAFGSGGPSGLVFGKPGISLPVPSPPSPGSSLPSHAGEGAIAVTPEAQRRSQRLARFAAGGDATAASPTLSAAPTTVATTLTKRPLSGSSDGAPSVQKVAKTSEDQTTKSTMVTTTITTIAPPAASGGVAAESEGKQEEDTPPAEANTDAPDNSQQTPSAQ